jgi:hypothetical protein
VEYDRKGHPLIVILGILWFAALFGLAAIA